MKQLNALGARRHQFFRSPHHRLRPLLLPALTDDLLDAHNDLYAAVRQPTTFAYFAGDFTYLLYIYYPLLLTVLVYGQMRPMKYHHCSIVTAAHLQ